MTTTPPTLHTPTYNAPARLVALATDFIESNKLQPISHGAHSRRLVALLMNAYEQGKQDAQQETLDALDEHVIAPIQDKLA